MIELTFTEAAAACGGIFCGDARLGASNITGISLDSRSVSHGGLFIAIRGERADGHDYIGTAIANGAGCALSERTVEQAHILVGSTFDAMKRIAAYIRKKSGITVVAVTGSVGKTSTRQMLTCVLAQKYRVHSTEGNFNNEYGLPQTLFKLEPYHELAVLEMGISHFGEMRGLSAVAQPNYAVFTNIGSMHLENLIDRDGVLRAKTELIENMPADGMLFMNGADDKLRGYASPLRTVYFGMDESYAVYPSEIRQIGLEHTRFTLHILGETVPIDMPAIGIHMVQNAIAAANVAFELGLTPMQIKAGIESYTTVGHRSRVLHCGDLTIIDDCYNAGPDSMRAAIDALSGASGRRLALLGDMLELGEHTQELHRDVGAYCAGAGLDALFTIGEGAGAIADGALQSGTTEVFPISRENAKKTILDYVKPGDVLLVKASRGMHFEDIIDSLMN